MPPITIRRITTRDARFQLKPGEGVDAVHTRPQYAYAVALLETDSPLTGTGLALTLGEGNELVCSAIQMLGETLAGCELEELMSRFGSVFHQMAEHPCLRWLGPHKGVVHLALAALTNACFDLWAKARRLPLWKLLLELSPAQVLALLDLSYLEDVLLPADVLSMLEGRLKFRPTLEKVLSGGYPGYDTSVGWFNYSDATIENNVLSALENGFHAFKLKVGSPDSARDIRRAFRLREIAGEDSFIMLDANQQWSLPRAVEICSQLARMNPFWIEEPTHPDDILAHQALVQKAAPLRFAVGEHLPNRVVFKNYMQAGAAHFIQVDCTRVGGVSEFITISLLARRFGLPVVPHVGDMGQVHQHLVLFNQVALGHQALFLEYIPHLQPYFVFPARIKDGLYQVPQEPGSSSDLKS